MLKVNTLSARIAFATLSILALGIIVLGIVFFYTFDYMEHKLLEMLDSSAEQSLTEQELQRTYSGDSSTYIDDHDITRLSSSDDVPEEFEKLSPGFHHDIEFENKRYHVAVKQLKGTKRYLIFDITEIEAQEHILSRVIIFGILAVFLSAIWVTYWLAKKVISPVQSFATQLENIDPDARNIKLAGKYYDVEIGSIARSFDRFMERLDGFVEREQSFTTTASHELRTPLSVISTSIELLENNPNLPDDSKPYIDKIKRSTADMSNLISALLFLARENQPNNQNPSEVTNITSLTQNILDIHKYAEKDKGIEIKLIVSDIIEVNAPRSHAQIVVQNLINNAIRFTDNGSVHVSLKNNTLEVIDTGTGIDDDTLKRIFDRGFRGKDSTGYGFGLYICKRICDRYNWNISISRNADTGSKAVVQF